MPEFLRILLLASITTTLACGPGISKSSGTNGGDDEPGNNTTSNNTTSNNARTNPTNNATSNPTNNATTDPTNNVTSNNATNNATNNPTNNNTTVDEPCVEVSQDSISFGAVEVGSNSEASLVVTNCSATLALNILGAATPDGFDALLPSGSIDPGQSVTTRVVFTPLAAGEYSGDATLDTDAGDVVVTLMGTGVVLDATCPVPVAKARTAPTQPWTPGLTASVGQTVSLSGTQSMANDPIVSYEWTMVTRPVASTASLSPSATSVTPTLFLDAHGTYVLELRAFTANSSSDCPATQITLTAEAAVDPNALVVTLVWDTPMDPDQTDDSGTDMDLHYKVEGQAWNAAPYDCYWLNPDADWMADGKVTVDLDDTDGAGPEQITHSYPSANGSYSVGAYYYAANGYGSSTATIRIHQSGVLLLEKQKSLTALGQFWYAGDYVMSFAALVVNDGVTAGFPAP